MEAHSYTLPPLNGSQRSLGERTSSGSLGYFSQRAQQGSTPVTTYKNSDNCQGLKGQKNQERRQRLQSHHANSPVVRSRSDLSGESFNSGSFNNTSTQNGPLGEPSVVRTHSSSDSFNLDRARHSMARESPVGGNRMANLSADSFHSTSSSNNARDNTEGSSAPQYHSYGSPPFTQARKHHLTDADPPQQYHKVRKTGEGQRAKITDYDKVTQGIHHDAVLYYKALLMTKNAYPDRSQEFIWAKSAWADACTSGCVTANHTPELIGLVCLLENGMLLFVDLLLRL